MKKLAKALNLKKITKKFNFSFPITLNGKKFKVPVLQNLGISNITLKEDWILTLFKKLAFSEDEVLIDVGVNVGQSLLAYRSCYSNPYYGFEPNPSCLYYLKQLIEINEFNKVNIIPNGLSNESGLVKFFLKSESDSAATIVEDLRPDFYANTRVDYIPVFKYDELDVIGQSKIGLVKIDVEGAELNVILGMKEMLSKYNPIVVCEILDYHDESVAISTQGRADKLVGIMIDLGYSLYKIKTDGVSIRFDKIDKVALTQWSETSSLNANDYLFIHPNDKRISIVNS